MNDRKTLGEDNAQQENLVNQLVEAGKKLTELTEELAMQKAQIVAPNAPDMAKTLLLFMVMEHLSAKLFKRHRAEQADA